MNTKRSDSDASDASDAFKKHIISAISGWCVSPFTPATGVQIPLGTPNDFKGLRDPLRNPFLF